MAEHFRTENGGTQYQWCDADLCVVMDKVTGELERAFPGNKTIGTFKEAKDWVSPKIFMVDRMVIAQLNAVAPFKI